MREYSTLELKQEISRREKAYREGRCWYCDQNILAHNCKYSKVESVPGWIVKPPRFVRTEDCMGNEQEYWQVNAYNTATCRCEISIDDSADVATTKLIRRLNASIKS